MAAMFGNKCKKACPGDDCGGRNNCPGGGGGNDGRDVDDGGGDDDYGQSIAINLPRGW